MNFLKPINDRFPFKKKVNRALTGKRYERGADCAKLSAPGLKIVL